MRSRCLKWLTWLPFVITTAQAQGTVQDDFQNPVLPDASVHMTQGSIFKLAWNSHLYTAFALYAPSANVSSIDLYLTGTYAGNISHLITTGLNVKTTFSINYTVDISDDELSLTNLYTFRFMPAGRKYTGLQDEQISSPGVVVVPGPGSALSTSVAISGILTFSTATTLGNFGVVTSTTSTTSVTTSTSATSTISSTFAPGSTMDAVNGQSSTTKSSSDTKSSDDSNNLSAGSIAGIVIGVVFGIVLIVAIIWLVARLTRQPPMSESSSPAALMSSTYQSYPQGSQDLYAQKSWLKDPSQDSTIPPPPLYRNGYFPGRYAELPILNPDPRAQLP